MAKKLDIAIVGFGSVGRNLAKLLVHKKEFIEKKYNIVVNVVAVMDSKGAVVKENGLSPYELLKLSELPRSSICLYKPYGIPNAGLKDVYARILPDVHVELTPSNYTNGEPGLSHIMYALEHGVNVVSSNKAPFVLEYDKIMEASLRKNLIVKFKATVMAGTPLIDLLMGLKGYEVEVVEGILNGTTNFILTEMHENLVSFSDALKKARVLGIAEANPDLDVKGFDAAAKLVIISNILGTPIRLSDVVREDLSRIDLRDVYNAIKNGMVIKFIARLHVADRKGSVRVEKIPRSNILASVNGTLNCVVVKTDVNTITVIGKGAGGVETAHAVLDDILSIGVMTR
ncbi:hypothetical protein J4526_00470 [Desulfurococcaceae archaeon MEX13E-LK6-19]|nr:hypothetical protein J4526_00470 [Desulfurococcaceae archaeon MEX13E-LK6-19]